MLFDLLDRAEVQTRDIDSYITAGDMRHNVLTEDRHEELMHIGNDLTQVTHPPQVG